MHVFAVKQITASYHSCNSIVSMCFSESLLEIAMKVNLRLKKKVLPQSNDVYDHVEVEIMMTDSRLLFEISDSGKIRNAKTAKGFYT